MCHPCVEDVGDPVLSAPDRANSSEDITLVGSSRASNDEIHRAMLPQVELAGLRRRDGGVPKLAEAHVAKLHRSSDAIRDEALL